ncbi:hypothetical protein D3I60_14655 [Brevibacterium permense]|uniref:CDP-glycerol glycerophosphotransferase family protein n=1 Tax=Brevibacterium permense TaxID=234834 RepID=UPI0021D14AC4|nr:CDP-glycerol glycerophosphotransferase family protein [Brevibacterium permense]MCU4298296.1 hypothetical protein [Brevibacterium permense]
MPNPDLLLNVVIETSSLLDKESTTYRRIMAARLRWEHLFSIDVTEGRLTTTQLREICARRTSKYIVIVDESHEISANYLQTMLTHLQSRTVYLAEPYRYTGTIPKNPATTTLTNSYEYAQDFDLHGVAFNTGRLDDALDALNDLDRTSLYNAYRLYWSINKIDRVETGYSIASDTKSAIGYSPDGPSGRLLPIIGMPSIALKLRVLRQLVLFLRGLRESHNSSIGLSHLRDLVKGFKLDEHLQHAEHMHPFECSIIRWLADPDNNSQPFKRLSESDVHLKFSIIDREARINETTSGGTREANAPEGVVLHSLQLGSETVEILRTYVKADKANRSPSPDTYNFYSRAITSESGILFFDRPMQADDNAEYLYDHFRRNYPGFHNIHFALNPNSPDWERLDSKGFKLVPFFSNDFYDIFLRSDLVVSSQIYNLRHKGKTLANSRFVYLQHGVQLNDMSNWVASKHFDIFVATGKTEADYLRTVAPLETLNSGIPRLQTLKSTNGETGNLLFMPTWRFNLHQVSPESFRESAYFQSIEELITDPDLLTYLDEAGATLQVKLHPNVDKRADQFSFNGRVIHSKSSYREAISSADFVFTDYSSAVIDAAFIETPIAYYQWDTTDFFAEQPYESRLDYSTDALGPLFTRLPDLRDHIVTQSYKTSNEKYADRRKRFFEGVEPELINDRIVERMLSL